jgi:hypothetical protein
MREKLLGSTAPPRETEKKKSATNYYGSKTRANVAEKERPEAAPAVPSHQPHQRQGDRSSAVDAAGGGLRRWVRFRDLVAAGIVTNWVTLGRLQNEDGFPLGILLGPNTRAWAVDEVEDWVARRPVARKIPGNVLKARQLRESLL